VEKAVEVVRTHEDGTGSVDGSTLTKGARFGARLGVDTAKRDDGGEHRVRASSDRRTAKPERSASSGDEVRQSDV